MNGIPWRDIVTPGMSLVDVGANSGDMTAGMAEAVGPSGSVLAFEPNPDVCGNLTQRCAAMPWVAVRQMALGQCLAFDTLYRHGESRECSRYLANVHEKADSITVPVSTLDAECYSRRVDGIKIDAQGDDGWVLDGGARTLSRMAPRAFLVIEIWPQGLANAGYDLTRLIAYLDAQWVIERHGKAWSAVATAQTAAEILAGYEAWAWRKHTNLFARKRAM